MKNSKFKMIVTVLTLTLLFVGINNNFQSSARELYVNNNDVHIQPECKQVRASHILVSTKEKALKIREEIMMGKPFAEAAQEYSKCPSAQNGGDLGYFEKGMMVPEFEQATFSMKVGQISEPIRTKFGWHLIELTGQK